MIDSFIAYLQFERNYSDKTIVSYRNDLEKFEEFFKGLDDKVDFTSVDADIIRSWIMDLMSKGYTSTSVNRKLSSLRSFYKYLLRKETVKVDPTVKVVGPKNKKPLPVFVKETDMDKVMERENFSSDFTGVRDRLIFEMFYVTGMRLSELIGLDDVDVDCIANTVKVTGKRNKQRIIPFAEELREDIEEYVEIRDNAFDGHVSSAAFFKRKTGERMYPKQVYCLVKKGLSKVVTLKKKSPHVLRHSFATSMLNHNASLSAIKEILGHESLETTQVYTHTTFEELKKVYEQAHPRA